MDVLSPEALYRDVPRPDEITAVGNFLPKIAENAEELIDWALSHIPPRAGPRGTRKTKRMAIRWEIKRFNDARRKQQEQAAELRRKQNLKRRREHVRQIKQQAEALRQAEVLRAQARAQKKSNAASSSST